MERRSRVNIVFDLDGTLIHSAPDIQAAANAALAAEGADELDLETTITFIGNGVPKFAERAARLRNLGDGAAERITRAMLDFFDESPARYSRLYDGLAELLPALREDGHRLGICTNKPEGPARAILDILGIADLFEVVIGGDSLPVKKPDPAPLHAAYDALGEGARLYVGDSEVDAETAHRAGVPFALFTQGYRKVPVSDLPHTVAFDDFAELGAYIPSTRL